MEKITVLLFLNIIPRWQKQKVCGIMFIARHKKDVYVNILYESMKPNKKTI